MHHLFLSYAVAGRNLGITLIDWPNGSDLKAIAEKIYSLYPQQLQYTDIVVLRPPVYRQGTETNMGEWIAQIEPLVSRAPTAELRILYSLQHRLFIGPNKNSRAINKLSDINETQFLEWLQNEELTELVRRSSALFTAGGHFVYKCPSGCFSNAFLRVGNVQMGKLQLDAFFFWLIPHLQHISCIVSDTWSVSSITLNAARLMSWYQESRPEPVDVQMLARYHDNSPEVIRDAMEVLRDATRSGTQNALFVISTIKTGQSILRLQEHIERASLANATGYIALYALAPTRHVPVLCDFADGVDGIEFDSFVNRPHGSSVIDIDRHTYFPLHVVDRTAALSQNKSVADDNLEFFQRYVGTQALAVHRDAKDVKSQVLKHHAFYVDVEVLLKVPAFLKTFKQKLAQVERAPSLILIPPHRAGIEMAEIARDYYHQRDGADVEVLQHVDLELPHQDPLIAKLQSLDNDAQLLVLDDVSVSGVRLSRYQQALRVEHDGRIVFSGRIRTVVGVARPTSEKAWSRRIRDHSYRAAAREEPHTLEAVEFLVLPNWSHDECPWCQEAHLLSKTLDKQKAYWPQYVAAFVRKRRRVLSDAHSHVGLINDAVGRPRNGRDPQLTVNSLFLPRTGHTDADVLFAISAVLQCMRKENKLRDQYPLAQVVDPEDYLGETFNDAILKLAIIRCAATGELGRWSDDDERERDRLVKELLLNEGEGKQRVRASDISSLRYEFFVAILAGKLPMPALNDHEWDKLAQSEFGRIFAGVRSEMS